VLRGTDPAAATTLEREPKQIVFHFSEPVEASFGAIRIFDTRGRRVESGEAFHPGGRGPDLAERLKPGLPKGSYTGTYRVISADGHPVSGGLVFSVGKASANPGTSVSELLKQRGGAGHLTKIGFGVVRGVQYGAIALAVGALFFVFAVWLPALALAAGGTSEWRDASEAFARRLRKLLAVTVAVGAISAALGIVFQGATAAGVSFWSALDSSVWQEVLHTRFGSIWGPRVLVWLGLGAVLLPALALGRRPVLKWASLGATGLVLPRTSSPPALAFLALLALPLGFLVLSPALAGHASLQHPAFVTVPANVLHVFAVCVWTGGLALLLFVLPAATRQLEREDRTRLLAAAVGRFSTVAGVAIAVLFAGGIAQSIVEVRTLHNVLHTTFGTLVLIKICLFTTLLALGAYNRRRMVPRLKKIAVGGGTPGRTGLLLRRALRAEVALVLAAIGVTSALVAEAPSIAQSSGPVAITQTLGPADLQLTVDPARVGANQVHFFLINKRDGTQFDRVKEFTVETSEPDKKIGPIKQPALKAGPGHYAINGASFGTAGTWDVKVTARVSAFDAYYATLKVPVR
jgi:copper transport protein